MAAHLVVQNQVHVLLHNSGGQEPESLNVSTSGLIPSRSPSESRFLAFSSLQTHPHTVAGGPFPMSLQTLASHLPSPTPHLSLPPSCEDPGGLCRVTHSQVGYGLSKEHP